MAGLMSVTAFLSMWINNSAATSIMLPVALAITDELEHHSKEFEEKRKTIRAVSTGESSRKSYPEVLDLTKVDLSLVSPRTEVVLNASHLQEPYVDRTRCPLDGVRVALCRKPTGVKHLGPSKPATREEKKYEDIKKGTDCSGLLTLMAVPFVGFLLAVAYSATIGGLSSLVGTAPNIFVKGFADR